MIICVVRNAEARNGEIRRRSSTSTKWQATHMEVPIHSQYPGPNSENKIKKGEDGHEPSFSLSGQYI